MGFIRLKFSSIFKHPLAKNTISQSSNLCYNAKLSGSTCNNPTLLFSRPDKRVHYSSSYLGLTHLRNYHNGHGTHCTNSVREYVVRKWGSWKFVHKLHYSMVGCAVFTWLVVCNWETVPYTNRKHYIPSSDICDPWFAKSWSRICDDKFKSHILDQNDPSSRRIFKITKDLLRALEKDLNLDSGSMTLSYCSVCEPTKAKFEKVKKKCWLQRRRERKVGKYHLDGMHWEVMVVDNNAEVPTGVAPNGNIVVTTDVLELCETDQDIATVIGHEVGHVVARHAIETLMIEPGILTILLLCRLGILGPFINWWYLDWRKAHIDYPISRSMEAEADRIGMMLLALAGYDPREAPGFYIKHSGDGQITTHPTGKKRAEMLRKESIMEEAVALYNKVKSESKQDN